MKPIIALTAAIALTACGQILQKVAARRADDPGDYLGQGIVAAWLSLPFALAIVCLGTAMLAWIGALREFEVSQAYPALSLNYVIVMLLSRALFGEQIPARRWLGVLLIAAGVAYMAAG